MVNYHQVCECDICQKDDFKTCMDKKEGKPYRPESAEEGLRFMEGHCRQCKNEPICAIPYLSVLWNVGANYPKEWVVGDDGAPTCTGFEWNGGQKGEC
jgi:hypothetical protein